MKEKKKKKINIYIYIYILSSGKKRFTYTEIFSLTGQVQRFYHWAFSGKKTAYCSVGYDLATEIFSQKESVFQQNWEIILKTNRTILLDISVFAALSYKRTAIYCIESNLNYPCMQCILLFVKAKISETIHNIWIIWVTQKICHLHFKKYLMWSTKNYFI